MELWTAARTDPELRELSIEVFGAQVARHPASEVVYQVLLSSMRGQALAYALQPNAPREGPHLQHWLTIVDAVSPTRP